jgi:hypothetical protein
VPHTHTHTIQCLSPLTSRCVSIALTNRPQQSGTLWCRMHVTDNQEFSIFLDHALQKLKPPGETLTVSAAPSSNAIPLITMPVLIEVSR